MGKLFRKTLFGGFRKKDVIAYLETAAAQRKEDLREAESNLQALQSEQEALQAQLEEVRAEREDLQQQLTQAQEHAAALRREADNAENRGAEARVRGAELEAQLAQAREALETLQNTVAELEEQGAEAGMLSTQLAQTEYQCQVLQARQEELQETLREKEEVVAGLQAAYDKLQQEHTALQQAHAALGQQRQAPDAAVPPVPPVPPELPPRELTDLRRELERMRDSYEALMLSMLGCGRQREPLQAERDRQQDLLTSISRQMDRVLECLEQLVGCRDRGEEPQQPAPVQEKPEAPADGRKQGEKKAVTLEEILRLVRGV